MSFSKSQSVPVDQPNVHNILSAVEFQFNKAYSLPTYVNYNCDNKDTFRLPAIETWFSSINSNWSYPIMLQTKDELNSVKQLLDDKPLNQWHAHTRWRNPAGNAIAKVEAITQNGECVNNGWVKFIACLSR